MNGFNHGRGDTSSFHLVQNQPRFMDHTASNCGFIS